MAQVDKSFTMPDSAEFHSSWILLVNALMVGPLLRGLLSVGLDICKWPNNRNGQVVIPS